MKVFLNAYFVKLDINFKEINVLNVVNQKFLLQINVKYAQLQQFSLLEINVEKIIAKLTKFFKIISVELV